LPFVFPLTPNSDASGTVFAVGPKVMRFRVGDNVCTYVLPTNLGGPFNAQKLQVGVGSSMNGTLRFTADSRESWLVRMPHDPDLS
jgi:NADPH:quinone reductase-like Zn-dependent oxidoreductase